MWTCTSLLLCSTMVRGCRTRQLRMLGELARPFGKQVAQVLQRCMHNKDLAMLASPRVTGSVDCRRNNAGTGEYFTCSRQVCRCNDQKRGARKSCLCPAGQLFELDGRRRLPVNHGPTTRDTLLADTAKVAQEFMARYVGMQAAYLLLCQLSEDFIGCCTEILHVAVGATCDNKHCALHLYGTVHSFLPPHGLFVAGPTA